MTQVSSQIFNKRRIVVLAKYDQYFNDISEAIRSLDVACTYISDLKELPADLDPNQTVLFIPHYSLMIPDYILSSFLCIGFHIGDLPKDRGGSPIQNKILRQEYFTKISAFRVGNEIDSGPIYLQYPIDLSTGSLSQILMNVSKLIAQMIRELLLVEHDPSPQIGKSVTQLRLRPENSEVIFQDRSIESIYDQIRMRDGFDYPRAFIIKPGYRILLTGADLEGGQVSGTFQIVRSKSDEN